jgi:hypothetical protein
MTVLIGGHSIVVNKGNLPTPKIQVASGIVICAYVHSRIHDSHGHSSSIGSNPGKKGGVARNRRRIWSSRTV